MGWKSKVKKVKKKATSTGKKATKTAKKVHKTSMKVANHPVVKTAVTAVATTFAGEAGAQVVENSYSVLNSKNPMDAVLGSVSSQYLVTKGYINEFKDEYINEFKDESSPLSVLISPSYELGSVASNVNRKSGSIINGVRGASAVSTVSSASGSKIIRKKSLFDGSVIDSIFDYFDRLFGNIVN